MSNLEKSIVKVLLESRGIYENHDEVVKKLNSSAKDFAGETPNFVHGKGPNKNGPDNGTHDTPKHSSPVKDHYHHQGEAGPSEESREHHVTVSHHEDGSATVHHTAIGLKWSKRDDDYNETSKHKEKHFKNLNDAIDHVGKLDTNH